MNEKETGLENFIERHRADFDAFEPRPDLWDELEQKLAAPTTSLGAIAPIEEAAENTRVVKLYPDVLAAEMRFAQPGADKGLKQSNWLPRPGVAAAVALLMLAGVGAVWNNQQRTTDWVGADATSLVLTQPTTAVADANEDLFFGASPVTNIAETSSQHLATAVGRMETYYATQIRERKEELRQLEVQTAVASAPPADWQRELAGLDSTYRQLKVELYRNPEPDVVLEAMNRNLQIRLDILNQQTRSREQVQHYNTQPLLVVDTHPMP